MVTPVRQSSIIRHRSGQTELTGRFSGRSGRARTVPAPELSCGPIVARDKCDKEDEVPVSGGTRSLITLCLLCMPKELKLGNTGPFRSASTAARRSQTST